MSILQRLRERFWFIPALLCLAAVVVAQLLVAIDQRLDDWSGVTSLPAVLYRVGESGSRDILGAIASSSLAVAGTTFSITMAVLALTSSTYGPRLVRNFMADRGNQTVLGVYVATFLYSLLVLRSIRALGDPGDQDAEVFVPHLAVNGAVLLAVANVGVLVYFIHHISDSIQVWTLAAEVRHDLTRTVDRMYPEDVGRPQPSEADAARAAQLLRDAEDRGAPVTVGRSGYVQFIRSDALVKAAAEKDLLVALRIRPGQYVLEDTVAGLVHPPARAGDEATEVVRDAIQVADARSPYQDAEFAIQQLTEMAVRALSPGTNDPYTAVNALDDLSVGLCRLVARDSPPACRYDDAGDLRVHAPAPEVVELVSTVLDSVRWYAASAPSVMHAALELVARVGAHAGPGVVRSRLVTQAALMVEAFRAAGHHRYDVDRFARHAEEVRHDLMAGDTRVGADDD